MPIERFNRAVLDGLRHRPGQTGDIGDFFNTTGVVTGAYRSGDGLLHLLVQTGGSGYSVKRFGGVEVKPVSFNHKVWGERDYLDFKVTHNDFTGNLVAMCNEVLDLFESIMDIDRALDLTLGKWELFLSRQRPSLLSMEARRGLFGELTVLNHLISSGVSEEDAVAAWLGPSGDPKDFILVDKAIEVKTTKMEERVVEIHGLGQLEDVTVGPLFLWVLLVEDGGSGPSLKKMVDDLYTGLPAPIAQQFLDKVHEAGYSAGDEEELAAYSSTRFEQIGEFIHPVEVGFPRLTTADVVGKQEVVRVDYLLDTSNLTVLGRETVLA